MNTGRTDITRRRFLSGTAASVASFAATQTKATGYQGASDTELVMQASPASLPILPGPDTNVWRLSAQVTQGDPGALRELEGSYLGPTIRLHRGQRLRVQFQNHLTEPSIVHWHGLHVPSEMDGQPRNAVDGGASFTYQFSISDRAGTYWYHPHPHGRTGPQVYYGMSGMITIASDEEEGLELPSGEHDIPIVIQDRSFDRDNQLTYLPDAIGVGGATRSRGHMGGMMGGRGMADMHARMAGFHGDRILVNGRPDFVLRAATRPYRLRLLNGSNARIYALAWSDGRPITVIGTDGGLIERPIRRRYVTLAPAQRLDLWLDLSGDGVGKEIRLVSQSSASSMSGGMMRGRSSGPTGSTFSVMSVRVERREQAPSVLPSRLSRNEGPQPSEAINGHSPRQFVLAMGRGMTWTINGRLFEMDRVADDEIVKLNTVELWDFVNWGGMGMMGNIPHPMHVHGLQFRVVERQLLRNMGGWQNLRGGIVDEGWQDTVLVLPGERVRVLMKFTDFVGPYMYHCHNLEHEDMGMMRNYLVQG